jgi:hypothetical protein
MKKKQVKKPIKKSIHFPKGFEYLVDKLQALHDERGDSVNLLIMKAIKKVYDDK